MAGKGHRKVGILTAGGDSPGLNAAIRGFGKTAIGHYGMELLGFRDGITGLVHNRYTPLDGAALSGILTIGGTILGTSRDKVNRFQVDGEIRDMVPAVVENYEREGLDGLILLGGGGTAKNALRLHQAGLNVLTLPKTIDNDIALTDTSFGFATAMEIATEAIDRVHSTAHSHHRIILTEVMGHRAGWLALGAGLAGGADVILIPEIPFTVDAVASSVLTREFRGSSFSIVVCAEGAVERGGGQMYQEGTGTLGGVGAHVATQVGKVTGKDARVVVLGHLQRGGMPTPFDRILATRFGAAAVRVLAEGRYGEVVVSHGTEIGTIGMPECAGKVRTVPPDYEMVRTARGIGIGFGDEDDEGLTPEPLA
jgi:ATP-dependent phosphofructokinase / diphosphate-dependent phosphofructokinase